MNNIMPYKYTGARSLVLLHEKHLIQFAETWSIAKKKGIVLPVTEDPDYKSLDTLLFHVFRSARGYIVWICGKLNLPDPQIEYPPENVQNEIEKYLAHLVDGWKKPLANLPEEIFHNPTFESNWGTHYCIDAMLEHAVMHPIRHEFQLINLINSQK